MYPKRIYILGSSGSGKTTLAKKLAKRYHLPHIDLDTIRWTKDASGRSIMSKDLSQIDKIAKKDKWLVEGIYIDWTKPLLKRADLILWLDIPLSTSMYRIIKRYLQWVITGSDPYGFKSFLLLARFLINYHYPHPDFGKNLAPDYSITKEKTLNALHPHHKKVIRITHSKQL